MAASAGSQAAGGKSTADPSAYGELIARARREIGETGHPASETVNALLRVVTGLSYAELHELINVLGRPDALPEPQPVPEGDAAQDASPEEEQQRAS